MKNKHPTTQTNNLLRQASLLQTAPTTLLLAPVDTTLLNTQPSPALNSAACTRVPNLNPASSTSSCHNQATTGTILPLIDPVPALNQGTSSVIDHASSSSSIDTQGASSSSSSGQAEIPTMGKSPYTCQICQKTFAYLSNLRRHHKIKHSQQQHQCNICEEVFSYRFLLKNHIKQIHTLPKPVDPNAPSTSGLAKRKNPTPTNSESAPKRQKKESPFVFGPKNQKVWRDSESESLAFLPLEIQNVYFENWKTIRTNSRTNPRLSSHTFFHKPNQKYIDIDWAGLLGPVFATQTCRFKVNYSRHLVLRHQETQELRFYHASYNNACVLDKPVLINNKTDFDAFVADLKNIEPLSIATMARPDTKHFLETFPGTTLYFYHLNEYPIGCLIEETLPAHITHNPYIFTLQRDAHNNKSYDDHKCFFRCLALHKGSSLEGVNNPTTELYDHYVTHQQIDNTVPFTGVTLLDIPVLENLYGLKIEIFSFMEEKPALIPKLRSTNTTFTDTMHLLHYKDHFCFISNIIRASRCFACPKCQKLWGQYWLLTRHEKTCNGANTKESFSGGVYTPPATIWETVASHGVVGCPLFFVFPYRCTFDYECFLDTTDLPNIKKTNAATKYTARHIPMSCAIASNVPGFEKAKCFVSTGDPQALVNKMIRRLEKIADEAYRLLKERFAHIFTQLIELDLPDLANRLNSYLKQVPIIGYNSGKYDLNAIKSYLVSYFVSKAEGLNVDEEEEDEEEEVYGEAEIPAGDVKEQQAFKYVVKRNNNFMCVATEKLQFLDIVNYLAPGFTYAKYLSAYKITEEKGVFCYEYINNLAKLEETKLPDHKEFFSKLKNSNITDAEYAECERIWQKAGMETLRDFLIWYNIKDVIPFLAALQKQVDFYAALHIDIFKNCISVPGATLRYLFKTIPKGVMFTLCSEKQKALHETMRNNITGGPSIIFHRYHEKDRTYIRGNKAKMVKSIKGFDANALYLHALMKPMPTDFAVIRKAENEFRAERQSFYTVQNRQWLSWVEYSKNVHLQTQYNGKEMALGKRRLRVDGWDAGSRTAYQFHGCMFHGHPPKSAATEKNTAHPNCPLTEGREFHPKTDTPLADLYEATQKNRAYLEEECNVTVVEMWECKWQIVKKEPVVKSYLAKTFARQLPSYTKKIKPTEAQILEAVMDDSLFGLVECDIHVPDKHKERFAEMTPIFKNTEVARKDIGKYMRDYAEENKLLNSPRRTLIGSYSGKQILLATPLLKWYLQNDLEVTKIYQVIEYQPQTCFKKFGDTVSEARRDGDRDDACAIKSETMKLLGNAAYGKTLTNKAKHVNVAYAHGDKTGKLVNNPRFRKMHEIAPDIYEVETAKEKIRWDLPLQIGFFVYQYAKLRMLEFYYDFLDKFISRQDFQLCEMDTDSLYLALSTPTLEEAVKPELLKRFYAVYDRWFPSEVCNVHKSAFVQSKGTVRPQNCTACADRKLFDKRTPGLFKVEYEGDGIVSLCSKTYHCFGKYNKTSTKGLRKAQNDLQKTHFMDVLYTTKCGGGKNISFKTLNSRIYSYEQYRQSLSFFYIKRQVEPDSVTTLPLAI
ncbi:hypothetical protein BsWGS_06109 [Bradybaena similaris]